MQKESLAALFDEILENPGKAGPETLGQVVHQTLAFCNGLKEKLFSSDPALRSQALEEASQVKEALEARAGQISQMIGMDADALNSYFADSSRFTAEDWDLLERAKSEIDQFKATLAR